MKKERIIYQDKGLIDFTLSSYTKAAREIQQAIDTLKDTGLRLDSSLLLDLTVGNGQRTKELAERQVNEEAAKFVLKPMQEQVLDQLTPLLDKIEEAQSKVYAALHPSSHSYTTTLTIDYFTIKDLTVDLVDGLEGIITDRHTDYADTPEKVELLERADKLKQEIEYFEIFLRKHGDVLHPVGGTNMWGGALYGGDVLLVHTKGGKCNVEIQHHVFGMLNKKSQ